MILIDLSPRPSSGPGFRPAPRARRRWPCAVAGLLLLGACGTEPPPAPPPPLVQIARPLSSTVTDADEVVGRFASIDAVEVRPRVSGYVTRVAFRDGQDVARGQLLFVIDPRPYRALLDRAQGAAQRARATLNTARVELERARALLAANATSAQEVQNRQVQAEQAAADLVTARADERQAALNVQFTEVRAAVAGRVSDRRANVGNLVAADQTVLTTLVTLDPIRFTFELSDSLYLNYLRTANGGRGADVAVKLPDETAFSHPGQVEFIDSQVSAVAGTIRGRAVLQNPGGRLTPGLLGRMRIVGGRPYRALLIPDTAVRPDQDRRVVLVLGRDDKAVERSVQVGPLIGGLRVIRRGLSPRDRVIIGGQGAAPGDAVRARVVRIPAPNPGATDPAQTRYGGPEAATGMVVAR